MPSLSPLIKGILFVGVYAIALAVLYFTNKREFRRSPEKGERYSALPWGYKCACWFGVVPLFAGTLFRPELFLGAIVAFLLVESFCVRWYRKVGLLR